MGLPCALATWLLSACAGSPPVWEQQLAEAHLAEPDAEEAFFHFGLWLSVHAQGDLVAPLSVAYNLSQAGEPESALDLITTLIRERPGEPSLLAASAALQRMLGFSRSAEHQLSRAFSLAPGDAGMAMELAELRLELGFPTGAIAALGHAYDAGRDDAELHRMLGTAWACLGEGRDSRRHFDAAIARSGNSSVAMHLEAARVMMTGPHTIQSGHGARRWIGAILDRAVELAPSNASAWLLRGLFLEQQGEHALALSSYEEACIWEPRNRIAWTRLALASLEAQDRERFGRALEQALSLEGNRRRARNLAALSHKLGPSVAQLDSQ